MQRKVHDKSQRVFGFWWWRFYAIFFACIALVQTQVKNVLARSGWCRARPLMKCKRRVRVTPTPRRIRTNNLHHMHACTQMLPSFNFNENWVFYNGLLLFLRANERRTETQKIFTSPARASEQVWLPADLMFFLWVKTNASTREMDFFIHLIFASCRSRFSFFFRVLTRLMKCHWTLNTACVKCIKNQQCSGQVSVRKLIAQPNGESTVTRLADIKQIFKQFFFRWFFFSVLVIIISVTTAVREQAKGDEDVGGVDSGADVWFSEC